MSIATWTISPLVFHLSSITILFLITWAYTLKGKFLIDDEEGIKQFSDSIDIHKDCVKDWYEVKLDVKVAKKFEKNHAVIDTNDVGKKKVRFKHLEFNPTIGFPGSIVRFLRLNLGKKFSVIGKNRKNHEIYGHIQDPFRHHIISLVVHFGNCLLLYFLLARLVGPDLAFPATLLFTVHPVSCQTVAWISGIGYLSSLFFALLSFNSLFWFHNLYFQIPMTAFCTFISMSFLLSGMANWVVFAMLGQWWVCLANFLISIIGLFTQGKVVWGIRSKAFEEQQMGRSTKFTFRRPIVMVKCFYYYCRLIIFPKRLGLFHTWGYHFDEKLQRFDGMFWKGVGCIVLSVVGFYFGSFPIKLGIVWFVAYLCLFLNVITAQQFVVDRYCFLSSVGFALVVASLLHSYPVIFALLLGLYMMRTLIHLPTFLNIKDFYKSNIFNFPDSEVAYGNLGVCYVNEGKHGSAIDIWNEAIVINPFYDVPNYNLYSIFKGAGQWDVAFKHLEKCLNAKTVHFPKQWMDEMEQMKKSIQLPIANQLNQIAESYKKGSYGKY